MWALAGACGRQRALGSFTAGRCVPQHACKQAFAPLGAPLPPPLSVLPLPPIALRDFDPITILFLLQMYLMYYTNEKGERVYTLKVRARLAQGCLFAGVADTACMHPHLLPACLAALLPARAVPCRTYKQLLAHAAVPAVPAVPQKVAPDGTPTESAHPARFSPDDKFSRERTTCKKRFGLLPTQKPGYSY